MTRTARPSHSTQANPSPEASNQQCLLDACVKAVGEKGLEALQMNHVIELSGLSRRTAYKYFKNKSEVVNAAFLREGATLFEGAKREVSKCTSVEDIFVYSFLYVYQHLPKNPLLKELFHNHEGLLENLEVKKTILETLKGFDLEVLFKEHPALRKDIYALSEYWIHAILSFLLLRSGDNKTLKEVEKYVRKRFIPGLCLSDYGVATTARHAIVAP